MKWIRTANGTQAHIVLRGQTKTLCGISLLRFGAIVRPGCDDRCANCDFEWRERGKAAKRGHRKESPAGAHYSPRHTFADWEGKDV